MQGKTFTHKWAVCASGVWPGVGCLGLTVLAFAYVKFTILENDATSHSFVTNVESFYITMVSVSIVQPSMNLEFIYKYLEKP